MTDGLEEEFRCELIQLVRDKYAALGRDGCVRVFAQVVRTLPRVRCTPDTLPRVVAITETNLRPPPSTKRGVPNALYCEDRPEGPVICVEVLSLGGLKEIESQVAERGILLPLSNGPPPSTLVDLCVVFPHVGFEVWFRGWVVFQSPSGIAIDIRPASQESDSLWREACQAYREKRFLVPAQAPETKQRSTQRPCRSQMESEEEPPLARSGGPRSLPPRLLDRAARDHAAQPMYEVATPRQPGTLPSTTGLQQRNDEFGRQITPVTSPHRPGVRRAARNERSHELADQVLLRDQERAPTEGNPQTPEPSAGPEMRGAVREER